MLTVYQLLMKTKTGDMKALYTRMKLQSMMMMLHRMDMSPIWNLTHTCTNFIEYKVHCVAQSGTVSLLSLI